MEGIEMKTLKNQFLHKNKCKGSPGNRSDNIKKKGRFY